MCVFIYTSVYEYYAHVFGYVYYICMCLRELYKICVCLYAHAYVWLC